MGSETAAFPRATSSNLAPLFCTVQRPYLISSINRVVSMLRMLLFWLLFIFQIWDIKEYHLHSYIVPYTP